MSTTDDRLRELAPIGADEVRALALDGETELCRAIAATPRRGRWPLGRLGAVGPHGRVPLAAVVASVALVALALGGLAAVLSGSGGGGPAGAPAAGPGATAQGTVVERSSELERTRALLPETLRSTTAPAPSGTTPDLDAARPSVDEVDAAVPVRYLPSEPGWTVTRADEYGREGEMTLEKDGLALELNWRTGAFSQWVEDREDDADRLPDAQLDGAPVTLLRSRDLHDWFIALWQAGGRTMELRPQGSPGDRRLGEERFRALLRALRPVSEGAWEAALPAGTVLAARRPAVASAMLADVPLPPGFDVDSVIAGDQVKERYQFGAQVLGAAACAWIDRWSQARRAGDRRVAREAAAAMATAPRWKALQEMSREGDYPEVLWGYARAMQRDGTVQEGRRTSVEQAAAEGLGCSDR